MVLWNRSVALKIVLPNQRMNLENEPYSKLECTKALAEWQDWPFLRDRIRDLQLLAQFMG